MDEKRTSKVATKLITRSKTKTSKSHKKIVTMLNNLSKDKTGAPVKWKFNKSGIKQANKVGKRLATAQEKDQTSDATFEQSSDITQKKETKVLKPSESIKKSYDKDSKIKEHIILKRKPGRPKAVRQENIDKLNNSKNQVHSDEDNETILNPLEGNSDLHENQILPETKNLNKVQRGRKKTVLSKDIRIKRLQILKRHMEKGSGRGRGKIKRIVEYHTTPDKKVKSESNEMNSQSSVSINQDKLKMLKEQIDSERRRGRGKGIFRKGRGRLKGMQDDNSISENSDQRKDINSSEESRFRNETNRFEILKRQVGRGTSHRGRRGRPKWKNLNVGNRSNESNALSSHHGDTQQENQTKTIGGRRPRRGRGATWTSLNRQTLSRTVLDQHTKQAVSSGNFPIVNETLIDSENESIDSNLSNASSRARKRKMFQHLGIKLGPAKLLRSQDSMKTRKYKDTQNQHVPKKRKRTLSGEFELLDEVSLRKKMREKDDDDTSTVKSFDDSWADMTDSELNDSQLDVSKGQFDLKIDTENKLIKSKSKTKATQRNELEKEKHAPYITSSKSRESSIEKDNKTVRRRGRPPKILSEKYETTVATKNRKGKDMLSTKHRFVSRNTEGRLTIIGPGGKHFIKIQNTSLEETNTDNSNELCNVVSGDLETDERYDDAKTSDLKDEVQIQDIDDESIRENEVVINVVIENTGVVEPEETKYLQVKDSLAKEENGISNTEVQNDINNKPIASFIAETEISQETILRSMKQVKHESKSKVVPQEQSDISSHKTENKVTIIEQEQRETQSAKEMGQDGEKKPGLFVTFASEEKSIAISTTESKTETLFDNCKNLSTDSTKYEKSDINISEIPNHDIHSEKLENNTVEKNQTSDMVDPCSSDIIPVVTGVANEVKSTSKEICDAIDQSVTTGVTNLTGMNESLTKEENKTDITSTDGPLLRQADCRDESGNTVNSDRSLTQRVSFPSFEKQRDNEEFENESVCESTESIQALMTEILDQIISSVCQNYELEISQNNQTLEERNGAVNDIEKPGTTSSNVDFVESVCNIEVGHETSKVSIEVERDELAVDKEVNLNENPDNNQKLDDENLENRNQIDNKISEHTEQSFSTESLNELETFSGSHDNRELNDKDREKDSVNVNQEDDNIKTKTSGEAVDKKHEEIKINTLEIIPQESGERNVEISDGTKETCLNDINHKEETNHIDSHIDKTPEPPTKEGIPMESQLNELQTKPIRKKDSDSNSKHGNVESEIQETPTGTPETSGKTETKRVFQLRKKASRSPLEIIAMKHSMEERQYMLEETQRAIRREEKQKKMFQNKMMRQTIEQLSPPKQQSPPKSLSEPTESISPEKSDDNIQDPMNICRPCSVVLIDFVKYLKMNEQSDQSGSVIDGDDISTTEEETLTEGESNEKAETTIAIDNDVMSDTAKSQQQGETDPVTKLIPLQLKRPAKARKQAKSYNYSSTLTAEIVSSPEPTDNGSKLFTVPPLRLKIKQKEKGKKRYKGHKWTASRNKARKQMSPVKRLLSRQKFEFETLGSKNIYDFEDEPSKIRKLDSITSDTTGSTAVPNLGTLSVENSSPNLSVQATRREQQETMYRFKCNEKDCEFKSQMRNIMESHIYIHLKDTPFKCSHCDLIFATRNLAFNHSKGTHPEKEAKIFAVNTVDESKYYEEINLSQGSDNSNVIQADIADVQHSSESLIISVRVPRNMTENTTGCYCCSHCEYYSSKIQDINAHVEEKHRELIQYICSVCNKAVYRHGEGIARHFSVEHPDQPVAYKSLPDFYDVRKTIEKSSANGDKGNIFDRMSDLFAGKKSSEKSKSIPEKTSAEADSTTAETDEDIAAAQEDTPGSEKSVVTVPREPDGIEQLAQMFGPPPGADRTDNNRSVSDGEKNNQLLDETSGNDMGLKIVDVVSLQGASDFAKNVWGESAPVSKSVPPYSNQLPGQVGHRPPVLIPTSSIRPQSQPTHNRPILPMPPQSAIDVAKLKTTTTTYKCEKCNVHAPILSAMVEHLRTGHKDIPRLFLCPYCRQYEGATEPDIHKHIKQFHPSPDTRSPPVALSSDAKQHLRTIEVPIGDTQKVNGKYLIEKNIYKCLKCKRHMPSLDYIYEHLEKEHNEVFVYVCPDCKRFRAKQEEVVFNHIKTVHNKNTDDIILSLAIEENLFTKVQCLIKDKSTQNKSNLQKPIPPPLMSQGVQSRQVHEHIALQQRPQIMVNYQQRPQVQPLRPMMQPVFPGMIQSQPVRMPGPTQVPPQSHPLHLQSTTRPQFQNQPLNKSAMRKSRPVHIPQQQAIDHVPTSHTVQHLPSDGRHMSSPPPLMRGPPPLIRFQGNQGTSQPHSEQSASSIRSANFSMSDKVHRLQPHSQGHPVSSPPPHSRPVLKVPSVPIRRTATASPIVGEGRTTLEGSPLDLSRNSTPNSQPDISDDTDDVSPDAFKIFNLQPVRPIAPQMHQIRYSQQVHNIPPQRLQQMGQFNPNMYNRPAMYNQMYNRPPPPYSQAIHQGQRPHSPPHQPALFKCPYCLPIRPLSMGEVAPHIKKYHPGQTVRFVKKD